MFKRQAKQLLIVGMSSLFLLALLLVAFTPTSAVASANSVETAVGGLIATNTT